MVANKCISYLILSYHPICVSDSHSHIHYILAKELSAVVVAVE